MMRDTSSNKVNNAERLDGDTGLKVFAIFCYKVLFNEI